VPTGVEIANIICAQSLSACGAMLYLFKNNQNRLLALIRLDGFSAKEPQLPCNNSTLIVFEALFWGFIN
jgi:hypothetical protein